MHLDYLYLSPGLDYDRAWIVESRASDHLAVVADIREE